jgi:excisionase family DNA binding protein
MEKLVFNRQEAAEALSISLRTLDSLLALKELRCRRVGRRVLISRAEVERFLTRDHATAHSRPR